MVAAHKEAGLRRGSWYYHIGDGFFYHKNTRVKSNRKISLRCVEYDSRRCLGRAIMNPDMSGFSHTADHNHGRKASFHPTRVIRKKILDRCRSGDQTPFKQIIQEETSGCSRRVRAQLMSKRLRSAMQRAQRSNLPKIPRSLSQLAATLTDPVHRHLCQSLDKKDFIYGGSAGSKANENRVVIFLSRRGKKMLRRVKRVHSDGTWEARPAAPPSSQLLSIVTTVDHQLIPIAVVLMEKRTRRCYDVLLAKLKMIAPMFRPTRVVCDFEQAEIGSWRAAFPDIEANGCFFHFAKDTCMYARSQNLTNLIKEEPAVDSIVRSACAIPLLPTHLLKSGLASIVRRCEREGFLDELGPFLLYIRTQWLRQEDVLSVYRCEERTNNSCECFHSLLRKTVGVRRPSIWRFLGAWKRIEDDAAQDWYTIVKKGGHVSRERKTASICNDITLQNLWDRLDNRLISISTFLREASRTVQNVYDDIFYGNGNNGH